MVMNILVNKIPWRVSGHETGCWDESLVFFLFSIHTWKFYLYSNFRVAWKANIFMNKRRENLFTLHKNLYTYIKIHPCFMFSKQYFTENTYFWLPHKSVRMGVVQWLHHSLNCGSYLLRIWITSLHNLQVHHISCLSNIYLCVL